VLDVDLEVEWVQARARRGAQMATERSHKPALTHWKFTVDEFQRMGEVGLFTEDDRVELIDGELIRMNPIGHGHGGRVKLLNHIMSSLLGERALMSVQDPVQLRPRGQPQPDIMVLRPRADYYSTAHPTAADVLLVIEVADSSLDYDLHTKSPMYAQAGIPDYWVVNIVDSTVVVLRQPIDGEYRSVQTLGRGDALQPLAFPDVVIPVAGILG
jgi:Uma2 family endonuclease